MEDTHEPSRSKTGWNVYGCNVVAQGLQFNEVPVKEEAGLPASQHSTLAESQLFPHTSSCFTTREAELISPLLRFIQGDFILLSGLKYLIFEEVKQDYIFKLVFSNS